MSDWGDRTDAGLSTSATLRRLEAELDRARKDYNAELAARVEAERELAEKHAAIEGLIAQRDSANQRWADARIVAENLAEERDQACALAVGLLRETGWIVARDGGRDCERCAHEIRRGEAYEYLGADRLQHIHCPNPEATDA